MTSEWQQEKIKSHKWHSIFDCLIFTLQVAPPHFFSHTHTPTQWYLFQIVHKYFQDNIIFYVLTDKKINLKTFSFQTKRTLLQHEPEKSALDHPNLENNLNLLMNVFFGRIWVMKIYNWFIVHGELTFIYVHNPRNNS